MRILAPEKRGQLKRCLVLGLLVLPGCTRWRVENASPAELLTSEPPNRIRITRADKSRVVLHRPQLVGDTIMDGRTGHDTRMKVSLNDVAEVAVRKRDPFGTTGLILGAAALGTVVTIGLLWDARAD